MDVRGDGLPKSEVGRPPDDWSRKLHTSDIPWQRQRAGASQSLDTRAVVGWEKGLCASLDRGAWICKSWGSRSYAMSVIKFFPSLGIESPALVDGINFY